MERDLFIEAQPPLLEKEGNGGAFATCGTVLGIDQMLRYSVVIAMVWSTVMRFGAFGSGPE
jgi:hypothetical protein